MMCPIFREAYQGVLKVRAARSKIAGDKNMQVLDAIVYLIACAVCGGLIGHLAGMLL